MDFGLISKVELIKENGEVALGIIQDSNEDKVYVSLVEDKKKFSLLRAGDLVRGVITEDDKVMGFNGLVKRRIFGDLPMYEIIYSDISKIQRREDFRMDCSIPVKFTNDKYLLSLKEEKFHDEEMLSEHSKAFNEGLIMDISGGGIRLLSNIKLEENWKTLFIFKFIHDEMILKGEIVHRANNDSINGMKYAYGVKFIDITDKKRETIIKNNFILMRKTSQK